MLLSAATVSFPHLPCFAPSLNRCLGSVAVVKDSAPLLQAHGGSILVLLGEDHTLYAPRCAARKTKQNKSKIIPDFANVPRIPPVPSEDGLQGFLDALRPLGGLPETALQGLWVDAGRLLQAVVAY